MSVEPKTEIVVSHCFSESNTLEALIILLTKKRIESESNLRAFDDNGIIGVAKHPIIMPTTETEAQ